MYTMFYKPDKRMQPPMFVLLKHRNGSVLICFKVLPKKLVDLCELYMKHIIIGNRCRFNGE